MPDRLDELTTRYANVVGVLPALADLVVPLGDLAWLLDQARQARRLRDAVEACAAVADEYREVSAATPGRAVAEAIARRIRALPGTPVP